MKLGRLAQAGSKITTWRRGHDNVLRCASSSPVSEHRAQSRSLHQDCGRKYARTGSLYSTSITRAASTGKTGSLQRPRRFSTMTTDKAHRQPVDGNEPAAGSPVSHKIDPATISEAEGPLTRRIHLLGIGSIGTLVAHSLKILPNPPPVTLMLHRPQAYEDFKRKGRIVRLINRQTDIVDETTGYDVDLYDSREKPPWHTKLDIKEREYTHPLSDAEILDSGETYIYNCIVTVKASATVAALKSVKHRMDARTTILLMQNGMGQIDDLNKQVFTDPTTRPTYMLGIISHGCHCTNILDVVHAGMGAVALGVHRDTDKFPLPPDNVDPLSLTDQERKAMYPSDDDLYANMSTRYLLRTLTRSTTLSCAIYPYLDLLQLQLEKLVGNCIVNPLTALLDFENGAMLQGTSIRHVQRLLIAEISVVLRNLPELQGVPNVAHRFSPAKLEAAVDNLSSVTARNSSSMREDVRKAKPTEIDYINGYVVRRGEEQGVRCALNYMITQMVNAKTYHQTVNGMGVVPKDYPDLKAEGGDSVRLEDRSKVKM